MGAPDNTACQLCWQVFTTHWHLWVHTPQHCRDILCMWWIHL